MTESIKTLISNAQIIDGSGSEPYLGNIILKDEIIEKAESVLAAHSPKAALGISRALTDDGSIPGANIRMEAAKQILDRVGLVKREKIDVNAKVAHGIFVLPAKEA